MFIQDTVKLSFPKKALVVKDGEFVAFDLDRWVSDNANFIDQADEGDSPIGIKIRVKTSASGMLINGRVYPGQEWKKAAKDFAGKPFLKHHDTHSDAIGRIQRGQFEQLIRGPEFKNDRLNPAVQGKGSPTGLVWVDATITDPDAIMKVQDERLLHVSQGGLMNRAICSVCGTDKTKDVCEHRPGLVYTVKDEKSGRKKKKLAYIIAEDLEPKEVSAVNTPAYTEAMIESVKDQLENIDPNIMKDYEDFWGNYISDNNEYLTSSCESLELVDRNGRVTDLYLVDRDEIELGNQHNTPADNNKDAGKTVNEDLLMSKELELEIKELKSDLKDSEKKVETLSEEKEALETNVKELETKASDAESKLSSLQDSYDELESKYTDSIERERQVLVDDYFSLRPDLTDEAKEKREEELKDTDTDALRTVVRDLKEVSVVGNKTEEGADGNKEEKTIDGVSQGNKGTANGKDIKDGAETKVAVTSKKNKRKLPV